MVSRNDIDLDPRRFDPNLIKPKFVPEYDQGFRPCGLVNRLFRRMCADLKEQEHVVLGFERENGLVQREAVPILPAKYGRADLNRQIVEHHVQYLVWARGAWRVLLAGNEDVCRPVAAMWEQSGCRPKDREIMADSYLTQGQNFEIKLVSADQISATPESGTQVGAHMDGVRLGLDIGASDVKVAVMINGKVVFKKAFKWNLQDEKWLPENQNDVDAIYQCLAEKVRIALRFIKDHHPEVKEADALGVSSAGIIVNNLVKVASWLKKVPKDKKGDIFLRLAQEFNLPVEVRNDGDVTALTGAREHQTPWVMGVALGSSVAGGYTAHFPGGGPQDAQIMGWLNELAFLPMDYNPDGLRDGWTKNMGTAAPYLTQQAMPSLLARAGISVPEGAILYDQLKLAHKLANNGDKRALGVFRTIGTRLGYFAAQNHDFYAYDLLLVLGRVVAGRGGDEIIRCATEVCRGGEFPDMEKVRITTPTASDDRELAQAITACTLVDLRKIK